VTFGTPVIIRTDVEYLEAWEVFGIFLPIPCALWNRVTLSSRARCSFFKCVSDTDFGF
jgi:hypothetical protein